MRKFFIIHFALYCVFFYIPPIFSTPAHAQPADSNQKFSQEIEQIYQKAPDIHSTNLAKRIEYFSQLFLGKPYLLGALGEGEAGFFDTYPLYRTDAFDCETYVDTVLALSLANNISHFEEIIRKIRYKNGKIAFIYRNHFTCLDWNQNNQKQGFIQDITTTIKDRHGNFVHQYAKAVIDKPRWYQHMPLQRIRMSRCSTNEQQRRLSLLKKEGKYLPIESSTIAYIPLSALFDKKKQANLYVFNQIPDAAIIEIVRPNWDLSQIIGTHLNVSHLGFAIWKNGTLYFRETSSLDKLAIDVPLIDYLRETLKSPTIKGINIQVARDPQTTNSVL